MHSLNRILAWTAVIGCLVACSSTRLVSTWKDPEVAFGALSGEKIAAFLVSDDESLRRGAEDALARELTARGGEGIAGHTLMSAQEAQDEAIAKRKLNEAGVVAVVTLRIVDEEQIVSSTPNTWHQVPYYRSWNGYWVSGWRSVYQPGYLREDTVRVVETLIYELASEKLIWAGRSRTVNPGRIDRFIAELAAEVDDAMKDADLLG